MNSQVSYHTATADLPTMMARHLHRERFMACCRQCPNFEATWACPPLSFDAEARMGRYRFITLLIAQSKVDAQLAVGRRDWEPTEGRTQLRLLRQKVLELERLVGGMALMPLGRCDICAQPCTRPQGLPCRHPELMRPAPEAVGLDVGGLTRDMAGIAIEWGKGGRMPSTITFVAALLHNTPDLTVTLP